MWVQHAKKVVSDNLGLVDFAIEPVNAVKTFPSSGLLAFAMESQDIAAIFREENSTLVSFLHEIFLKYINIC